MSSVEDIFFNPDAAQKNNLWSFCTQQAGAVLTSSLCINNNHPPALGVKPDWLSLSPQSISIKLHKFSCYRVWKRTLNLTPDILMNSHFIHVVSSWSP